MSLRPQSIFGLLALVLALVCPPALLADWLVTQDGARIETKGPWRVDGKRVIFTMPNGTLSAMRVSELDLEASNSVTEAARNPRPAAAAQQRAALQPQRAPVLVLTNKDIAAAAPPPSAATGEGGQGAAEPRPRERPAGAAAVSVVTWESRDSQDVEGLEVVGTLRNTGVEIATNINVSVTVIDQERTPLYETTAFLRSSGLAPGKSTTFRALLPGIYTLFEDPIFDVQSGAITVQGPSTDPADQTADGDGFDPDGGAGGGFGADGSGADPGLGGSNGGGGFNDEEAQPPGVIEGVDPSEAYEEPEIQEPQGDYDGRGGRGGRG